MDDVLAWGIEALHRAIEGLSCTTAVHICYGYGIKANIDWKATLGSEWRQYEQTFPALAASKIDQISIECANSRVPVSLLGLLGGKDVLVGAVDVATDAVETPAEVAATIRRALPYVPAERRQDRGQRDRHDDLHDRARPAAAVDHRRLLDVLGDRLEEPHEEPHAEGDRERRVDDDQRPQRVLQAQARDDA